MMKKLFKNNFRELSVIIAILAMALIFGVLNPAYLRPVNLIDILDQATIYGLMGVGIMLPIITGGICRLRAGVCRLRGGAACSGRRESGALYAGRPDCRLPRRPAEWLPDFEDEAAAVHRYHGYPVCIPRCCLHYYKWISCAWRSGFLP